MQQRHRAILEIRTPGSGSRWLHMHNVTEEEYEGWQRDVEDFNRIQHESWRMRLVDVEDDAPPDSQMSG
jgi:hypothetical protein